MKKRIMATILAMTMVLSLAACGGGNSGGSTPQAGTTSTAQTEEQDNGGSFTGEKYVSDKDGTIKTAEFPSNYTPLPYDQFKEGFKAIVNGEITTSSSYEDVAKAFGDDGIKLEGQVYSGYAYYGWYSDKDLLSDNKVGVLITFKSSGGNLTYYAYSSNGILPEDVK